MLQNVTDVTKLNQAIFFNFLKIGFAPLLTVCSVIVQLLIFLLDGISNIISNITFSITDLNALAPVFLFSAISTIADNASAVKSNFTPSRKNNF